MLQRLKGLTTGGLPTFIDFRDNFHSPEIAEDNWVAQVKARAARLHGRNSARGNGGERESGGGSPGGELVFMGDDTWTSLYPTYFTRSFPFPSFNTRCVSGLREVKMSAEKGGPQGGRTKGEGGGGLRGQREDCNEKKS